MLLLRRLDCYGRGDCLPGEGVTEEEGEETACQGRVLLKRKEERRLGGCYEEARLPAWGGCY